MDVGLKDYRVLANRKFYFFRSKDDVEAIKKCKEEFKKFTLSTKKIHQATNQDVWIIIYSTSLLFKIRKFFRR